MKTVEKPLTEVSGVSLSPIKPAFNKFQIPLFLIVLLLLLPVSYMMGIKVGKNNGMGNAVNSVEVNISPSLTPDTEITEITEMPEDKNYENTSSSAVLIDTCGKDKCLFRHPSEDSVEGFGKLTGYYQQSERDNWGERKMCDALVITNGTKPLIDHFEDWVRSGNGINRIDTNGKLMVNIDLDELDSSDKQKVINASENNPVTLGVIRWTPRGVGADACTSFVNILFVE